MYLTLNTHLTHKLPEKLWVRNKHSGYWCPGAKAPGHQYPQYWRVLIMLPKIYIRILYYNEPHKKLGV